ncbi:MAG: LacI family DNA-binding transcriptional regulator [Phycisphaerales bacterium JB063]
MPKQPTPPPSTPDASPAKRPTAANGAPKRVGIREIASKAEVSAATVSMVLNNNPKITAQTRRKVNRVVKELGYRPNRIAQSLSSKYTNMLAVLMPTLRHTMADPYFGELISGICDKAARLGHKVMLEHAKPDFIREKKHLDLFDRRFIDGVLCIGFSDLHTFLGDFAEGGYRAMMVNSVATDLDLDYVMCDYDSAAQQIMTYLFQLGHRKIGMIHGAPEVYTMRQMMGVYRARMQEHVGEVNEGLLVDGRFTEEHGYAAANQLLDANPEVTAIFAGNDKMALGALHCASQRGLSVPDELSIIGCDDIQYAAFVNPSLTTINTPLYEAGAIACERLIDRIHGSKEPVAHKLQTHLVLRQSTAINRQANGLR